MGFSVYVSICAKIVQDDVLVCFCVCRCVKICVKAGNGVGWASTCGPSCHSRSRCPQTLCSGDPSQQLALKSENEGAI